MPFALALLLALALLAPSAALGGGWATTALSSTPDGPRWTVDLTILQHGRTPASGLSPSIVIRSQSGEDRRFEAVPTRKTGVYRARVVFPRTGRWAYTVYNGFDNRPQRFPAVTIGGRAAVSGPAGDGGGLPAVRGPAVDRGGGLPALSYALGGAGLALLLGSGAGALRGRTRPE